MSLLNVFRVSRLGASSRCGSPISRAVIVRLAPRQSRELLRLRLPLQSRLTSTKAGWKKATPEPGSEHAARKYMLPERLCLYHAGTGRITFLACLRLTTLFIFIFFGFVVAPAYYEKEGISPNFVRTTACAIVPLFFVAYTTAPFVTFVHVRLPPWARQSKEMLQRFVEGLDNPTKAPSMELELTTMSFLSKPRVSRVAVSELRPASARFGIVNYTRDVAAQNAARPWYHFPAVANFSIQTNRTTRSNNPWLWNVVAEFIAKQRA